MTSILTGFVLACRDHREHDRFYTLYTRERGKVQVMAVGARKFSSKLAAHASPFTELTVMVAHGKLWLKLAGVERGTDFGRIRQELSLFTLGLGLNELMHRAIGEGEPDAGLYAFLADAYAWIQTLPELTGLRLTFVQSALTLKWLVLIGFGPHADACVRCRAPYVQIQQPHISTMHGGLVCGACVREHRSAFADAQVLTQEVLAALRFLSSAPFEALLTDKLDPLLDTLIEIQDAFTHYHLERELRVPTFLQHIATV
ncbi:TPA: DNA repair protein RecO [Candidatus Uhrbacteria bacterium]|nr:DNA repair protein RecO [Candidatus Uhrbacteria bacterium]